MPTPVTASAVAPGPSPEVASHARSRSSSARSSPASASTSGTACARNMLKRVSDWTSDTTVPTAKPEQSRSRDQRSQPGLADPLEAQPGARAWFAGVDGQSGQPVQPPGVTGILRVPAGSLVQYLHDIAGEGQERRVAARLRTRPISPLLG